MTARQRPGPGEIVLTLPHGRRLCHTLEHHIRFWPATVVAHFGPTDHPALFIGCSGRSYPLCTECWHHTRRIASAHLVIHDLRP